MIAFFSKLRSACLFFAAMACASLAWPNCSDRALGKGWIAVILVFCLAEFSLIWIFDRRAQIAEYRHKNPAKLLVTVVDVLLGVFVWIWVDALFIARFLEFNFATDRISMIVDHGNLVTARVSPTTMPSSSRLGEHVDALNLTYFERGNSYASVKWNSGGIGYIEDVVTDEKLKTYAVFILTLPVLYFIPPLFIARLVLAFVNRRKFKPGHCPKCGYDLRATPERCPECGLIQADVSVSTTVS